MTTISLSSVRISVRIIEYSVSILASLLASGDLRNVIHTVNNLPLNYSGKLTILLDDVQPSVAIRNLVLLLLLGDTSDPAQAAELAVHLWYSAFVTPSHHHQLYAHLFRFSCLSSANTGGKYQITPTCSVASMLHQGTWDSLLHITSGIFPIKQSCSAELENIWFVRDPSCSFQVTEDFTQE